MSDDHPELIDLVASFDADARAAAVLPPEVIEEIASFGTERTAEVGDVLYRAGEEDPDFYVVLDGVVEIVRHDDRNDDLVLVRHGAGRFVGELNLLTG